MIAPRDNEERMLSAAWRRFEAWLPRLLTDEDRAAIHAALAVAMEKCREPTYTEVLEVVWDHPGSDAQKMLAYLEGEWAEE